jgi:hypothetical protein
MSLPIQVYTRFPLRLPKEWKFSNYCLLLNGANYVEILNFNDWGAVGSAVELWWKPTLDQAGRIFYATDGTYVYQIVFRNSPYLGVDARYWDAVTGDVIAYAGNGSSPLNRWIHIVAVFEVGSGVAIYVNGSLRASAANAGVAKLGSSTINFGRTTAGTNYVGGCIDEGRIIPSIPSAEQVRESFRRGYARKELDARLILRLEEGFGLTARDESGYNHNGNLLPTTNPPTWKRVKQFELLA